MGRWNPESLEDKFWSKVDRRSFDECWPWTAGCKGHGYGNFCLCPGDLGVERKTWVGAHRLAYRLVYGYWPEPKALHGCDNPPCCNAFNPAHVHSGTMKLNFDEMVQRDRHSSHFRFGDEAAQSKLTSVQVLEMRALYAGGGVTYVELAERYGITFQHVGCIVTRKSWTHV